MSMADRIRDLVKRHPKKRQQIADELFISVDCLGNYINWRRSPNASMVCQMALYFHVSTDYILCISPPEECGADSGAEQEQNLLHLFRGMSPSQQEFFLHSGYGIVNYKNDKNKNSN